MEGDDRLQRLRDSDGNIYMMLLRIAHKLLPMGALGRIPDVTGPGAGTGEPLGLLLTLTQA